MASSPIQIEDTLIYRLASMSLLLSRRATYLYGKALEGYKSSESSEKAKDASWNSKM
jgi:hypothetical protein